MARDLSPAALELVRIGHQAIMHDGGADPSDLDDIIKRNAQNGSALTCHGQFSSDGSWER